MQLIFLKNVIYFYFKINSLFWMYNYVLIFLKEYSLINKVLVQPWVGKKDVSTKIGKD